jgi:tetratricopeptide (TPR) repeat protein
MRQGFPNLLASSCIAAMAACALACALLTGCAVAGLGRGGGHPATAGAMAEPSKGKRDKKARGAALEPLEEARVRASEQPAEPWWPYRAAELSAAAGRPADAEASLREAIGRDSAYAPALAHLSRTLYEQGRHEEALRLLAPVRERRVSLPPEQRAALLSGLALHEAALGRDSEARETLELLSRDERSDAVGVASYLAARVGAADSSAASARAVPRAADKSAAVHNNRGIALLRAGDPDQAQREFERAIELEPSRAAAYYNLAILERWYRLDTDAAVKRFQQYWSRSHADPDSLYPELGRGLPPPETSAGADR